MDDRSFDIWIGSPWPTAGIAWGPSGQAAPPACSGLLPPPSWPLPIRFLLTVGRAARRPEHIGRKSNTESCPSIPLELRAKTISVALADADPLPTVGAQLVAPADRMGSPQAVEDATAAVVVHAVVLHDVPDAAAARVQACPGVVVDVTAFDQDVGALLEADCVAAVAPNLYTPHSHAPRSDQEDSAPTASVKEHGLLLGLSIDRQALDGGIMDVLGLDHSKDRHGPSVLPGVVVVVQHPVDEQPVAVAADDRGHGRVKAAGAAVQDVNACPDGELVGLGDDDLVMAVAEIGRDAALDTGGLAQDGSPAADDADARSKVQGIAHLVDAGRDDHRAAACLRRIIDSLLDDGVGRAAVLAFPHSHRPARDLSPCIGRDLCSAGRPRSMAGQRPGRSPNQEPSA